MKMKARMLWERTPESNGFIKRNYSKLFQEFGNNQVIHGLILFQRKSTSLLLLILPSCKLMNDNNRDKKWQNYDWKKKKCLNKQRKDFYFSMIKKLKASKREIERDRDREVLYKIPGRKLQGT